MTKQKKKIIDELVWLAWVAPSRQKCIWSLIIEEFSLVFFVQFYRSLSIDDCSLACCQINFQVNLPWLICSSVVCRGISWFSFLAYSSSIIGYTYVSPQVSFDVDDLILALCDNWSNVGATVRLKSLIRSIGSMLSDGWLSKFFSRREGRRDNDTDNELLTRFVFLLCHTSGQRKRKRENLDYRWIRTIISTVIYEKWTWSIKERCSIEIRLSIIDLPETRSVQ